jgi:ATP-dependent Clp protease ATP-binding subunit ClpX
MSDSKNKKGPRSLEEVQKELQDFFKEKFGADIFTVPLGAASPPEPPPEAAEEPASIKEVFQFRMTPAEVKAHFDRFVIGQDEAKRTLAVAVCDHYNHVRRILSVNASAERASDAAKEAAADLEFVKQNLILLGPTGVGKTYLIRILAQLVGVPFVKADITKFSETGYVGGDVEDLVRELVRVSGNRPELAAYGIIFLDEIDKIASAPNALGRDPSGRGVQIGLLKLMEDTEVPLRSPYDLGAQFQDLLQMRRGAVGKRTLNTRHILFVVSGAFSNLGEIIEKRLSERNVGFAAATGAAAAADGNILSRVTTRDFVDYGFEPEFIGRLPIRVALDELAEEDLYSILKTSEGSILHQYRESFRGYGLEVAFEDEALRALARRAFEEKTGARGLMTVLESCLRDFKFHLPGSPVRRFAVSGRLVENPRAALEEILRDPARAEREYAEAAVREFEDDFERLHGVRLELDPAATEMAVAVASEMHLTPREYLEQALGEHAPFLRKVASEARLRVLRVTPQVLNRPAEGLDLWMRGLGEQLGSAAGRA